MTEQTFWRLMEESKITRSYSPEGKVQVVLQLIALTELLSDLSKEELISFELILRTKLKELYTGKVLELFILADNETEKKNGRLKLPMVLSDDQFLYFRCWLILQGEAVFKDILKDPELILNHDVNFSFTWGESLLYVAEDAYKMHHENKDYSEIRNAAVQSEPSLDYDFGGYRMSEKPNFETIENRYPNLVATLI